MGNFPEYMNNMNFRINKVKLIPVKINRKKSKFTHISETAVPQDKEKKNKLFKVTIRLIADLKNSNNGSQNSVEYYP